MHYILYIKFGHMETVGLNLNKITSPWQPTIISYHGIYLLIGSTLIFKLLIIDVFNLWNGEKLILKCTINFMNSRDNLFMFPWIFKNTCMLQNSFK